MKQIRKGVKSSYERIHGGDSVDSSSHPLFTAAFNSNKEAGLGTGAPAPAKIRTHGRESMELQKTGLFITLEGPEGSGKTTLAKELYRVLRKKGYEVLLTYEPGGSSLGKVLRRALLQNKNHKISDLAELFLFEADRAQHVLEVILPALQQGKIVLCCRYCDSTTAYQGYGRGLDLDFVLNLNQRATKGLEADITLLLDLAPEQGLPRAFRARGSKDRLESEKLSFHRRLRRGYLDLAKKNPQRIHVISARRDFETVKAQSVAYISKKISSFGF